MKRKVVIKVSVATLLFIACGFLLSPNCAYGWGGSKEVAGITLPLGGGHHALMTKDALEGLLKELGLTNEQLQIIAKCADAIDTESPDPERSCHRTRKYRNIFNEFPGTPDEFKSPRVPEEFRNASEEFKREFRRRAPGAEDWAKANLIAARKSYLSGNINEALRHLGYAIHYIQDALCPSHVFPFQEIKNAGVHLAFEIYAYLNYGRWRESVKKPEAAMEKLIESLRKRDQEIAQAIAKPISSGDELLRKIRIMADEVYRLPARFLAPDGEAYAIEGGDERKLGPEEKAKLEIELKKIDLQPATSPLLTYSTVKGGWYMEDRDIGLAMAWAAALVRDAAKYVFSKPKEVSKKDKIIFISERGLEIINEDGTERKLLVSGDIHRFAISPDGRKIAFKGLNGIEIINIDGTERKPLITCSYHYFSEPVFSPDGSKLAFGATDYSPHIISPHIIVSTLDGSWSKTFKIAPPFSFQRQADWIFVSQLRWSPDGRGILFRICDTEICERELFLLDLSTGKVKKSGIDFGEYAGYDAYDVSNNKKIIFVVEEGDEVIYKDCKIFSGARLIVYDWVGGNKKQIFSIVGFRKKDFSQKQLKKLEELYAQGKPVDLPFCGWIFSPRWSPDGKKIAFWRTELNKKANSFEEVEECVLAVIDSDGRNYKELSRTFNEGGFAWSPDSKKIAYSVDDYIWVVNLNGRDKPRRLVKGIKPSWFPTVQAQPKGGQAEGSGVVLERHN